MGGQRCVNRPHSQCAHCAHPAPHPPPRPRFDTATGTWAAVEPAGEARPPKRSYAAAASAGGKLYIFGGCGEGCTGRLNDLWEYCPAANRWRQLPSSDAIQVRRRWLKHERRCGCWLAWQLVWARVCAPAAGNLLASCGHRALLHAAANWFALCPSHPQGRGGPGFVAAPGALFVVAGFAGHETNDVHR